MAYRAQSTTSEQKPIPSSSLVPRLPFHPPPRSLSLPPCRRRVKPLSALHDDDNGAGFRRRDLLLLPPLLTVGTSALLSAAAWAEEKPSSLPDPVPPVVKEKKVEEKPERKVEEPSPRIYDATVIGEPQAVGKGTDKVWEKLLGARIVYLGEAELVPDRDDRSLELEIVSNLRNKCFEQQRPVSLALEIFPSDQQEKLNLFMSKRIDGESLKFYNPQWPPQLWKEYEPLLNYCRDNGVRLVACGTPLEVLRTVQAEGLRGLSKAKRKKYAPPVGSGFASVFDSSSGKPLVDKFSSYQSVPFAPYSYLSAQTRAVDDYAMSKVILKAMNDGSSLGMLVVVTGASHVVYGSRGIGIPARISKKMQKKYQSVVLLDPERQQIRHEGEVPIADFLWYSAAKPCNRNCFDRAEIARVMNAAVRRRDALPKDLQAGLDLGLVSPENLQNFFDLEKYPFISELINRFQGFRERLLVDPQFLQRVALEESISITTTLIAQYKKRKDCFFEEIDYVITDTIRVTVVDFFSVWLPAPTLSFVSSGNSSAVPEKIEVIKGFLGSIPDNAFQKATAGKSWDLSQRFASALIGGMKFAGVGFVASVGTIASSNFISGLRSSLKPTISSSKQKKSMPVLKSAVVYALYLATSANLRYQVIAGIVEHRIADMLLSYYNLPILVTALSFVTRTINCYWGSQQWVDLARFSGLQPPKRIATSSQHSDVSDASSASDNQTTVLEDVNNPSGGSVPKIASSEDQRLCKDDVS